MLPDWDTHRSFGHDQKQLMKEIKGLEKITKRDVTAALHTSLPIMVTFIVLGIGYGILMQKHGFGPLWSLLSGIIIISGTVLYMLLVQMVF